MDMTLLTALEDYLITQKANGCSEKTMEATRKVVERFIRFLQERGHSLAVSDLATEHARAYLAALAEARTKYEGHPLRLPISTSPYAPHTVLTHLAKLRAFSNWLTRKGYTTRPAFTTSTLPKLPKVEIVPLSSEEVQQILTSINADTFRGSRLLALLLVMIDTRMRSGEVVSLRLGNIDWDQSTIRFTKRAKEDQSVRIGDFTEQALLHYVRAFRPEPASGDIDEVFLSEDGYRLSVNAVVLMMKRLAHRSGVRRLHADLLRHSTKVGALIDRSSIRLPASFPAYTSSDMTHHDKQLADDMLVPDRKYSPVDSLDLPYRQLATRKRSSRASPHN